ncbi:MAG: hypothetical protein ACOZAA_02200 [Pseudomonadota bacterium]
MRISRAHEWLLKAFIAIAFVVTFLSFNTVEMATAPDNAEVYYNTAMKTYAAPFCMKEGIYANAKLARQVRGTVEKLVAEGDVTQAYRVIRKYDEVIKNDAAWSLMTEELGSLKPLGYDADYACKNTGAFIWEENSLMVSLGIRDNPRSRWSADGKWNW